MRTSRESAKPRFESHRRTHDRPRPSRRRLYSRDRRAMPVTEKNILTAELRLEVQEFYFRYAECLDGGRLQQWPEFFVDACTYRVATRRNLRMGPDDDLVSLSTKTSLRD